MAARYGLSLSLSDYRKVNRPIMWNNALKKYFSAAGERMCRAFCRSFLLL